MTLNYSFNVNKREMVEYILSFGLTHLSEKLFTKICNNMEM